MIESIRKNPYFWIAILIAIIIIVIFFRSVYKERKCAKKTNFNLKDLNPGTYTTTTHGANKEAYLKCMGEK